MKRPLKFVSTAFALALATGALTALAASPAGAAAVSSCAHVTGTATFSPGVNGTSRTQTITSKGSETSCTPSKSTGGAGTLKATIKAPKSSCTTLVKGGQTDKGTATTTWKNKKVSKFNITLKTGTGKNFDIATITGKVTSGLFAGKSFSGQVKFTVKSGQNCTTVPVKNLTFKNTKPFVLK